MVGNRIIGSIKKLALTATLTSFVSVGLAACGENAQSTQPTATTGTTTSVTATTGGSEMQEMIVLKEWAIEPKTIEVPAGKISFLVTNEGRFGHNVVFEGTNYRTPTFESPEGTQTLEAELQPGTYKMICDVPGHPEQGMVGELIVK